MFSTKVVLITAIVTPMVFLLSDANLCKLLLCNNVISYNVCSEIEVKLLTQIAFYCNTNTEL